MVSLKECLAVKYGLFLSPSPDQIERWKQRTRTFISMGMERENAADIAAQAIFSGYGSRAPAIVDVPLAEIFRSEPAV